MIIPPLPLPCVLERSGCSQPACCPCRDVAYSVTANQELIEAVVSAFFGAENSWDPHCLLQRWNLDARRKHLRHSGGETEETTCHRTMTWADSRSSQVGPREVKSWDQLSPGVLPLFRSQIPARLKLTFPLPPTPSLWSLLISFLLMLV